MIYCSLYHKYTARYCYIGIPVVNSSRLTMTVLIKNYYLIQFRGNIDDENYF